MADFSWLLPSITIERTPSRLEIGDFRSSLRVRAGADEVLACLLAMDGSRRLADLRRAFPAAQPVLRKLDRRGWLVRLSRPLDDVIAGAPERSRQLSYFAHLQPDRPDRACVELAERTAVIVGVGGVGSHVAMSLAGSGLGRIILNDPDVVEPSNLNRQILFTVADVGRPKVEVVAEALRRRFPRLVVETVRADLDVTPDAVLPAADAIIVCGECVSVWDRPELVADTPLLMAGYFGRSAAIGPCIAPAVGGTCWACLMRHYRRDATARGESRRIKRSNAWNPSGASINGIAGGLLGEAALRLLAPSLGGPLLLNERIEVDTATLSMERAKLDPGPTPGGPCFCRSKPKRRR